MRRNGGKPSSVNFPLLATINTKGIPLVDGSRQGGWSDSMDVVKG